MCLHLEKGATLQIAEEDIIVYKSLEYENGIYFTPYRECHVEMGKTYTSELNKVKADKDFVYPNNFICDADIFEGLHAFMNYEETIRFSIAHERFTAKCIIPKGSSYYVGLFAEGAACASDKLTYVEIIE